MYVLLNICSRVLKVDLLFKCTFLEFRYVGKKKSWRIKQRPRNWTFGTYWQGMQSRVLTAYVSSAVLPLTYSTKRKIKYLVEYYSNFHFTISVLLFPRHKMNSAMTHP